MTRGEKSAVDCQHEAAEKAIWDKMLKNSDAETEEATEVTSSGWN